MEIKEHLLKLWQILWKIFESEIEIGMDKNYYKQLVKVKQIIEFISYTLCGKNNIKAYC